ncbi:hypothetical protein [Sorangium sp. So ce233]|uniref:hypothetical protein n=1 Tax=Sorangium sp. So ce233 TaxID=3133290 RepID=UPI003F639A33
MKSGFFSIVFCMLVGASGCIAEFDTDGELIQAEESEAEEHVAQAEEALNGVYDIGVIPASGQSCPAGSAEIMIHMDDEDRRNISSARGWTGRISSNDENTTFYFCEVDGSLFRPLSTVNNGAYHYAVLKLGTTCPPGSVDVYRFFDNENDDNGNGRHGDIYPNTSNVDTGLNFCLFRYALPGNATMTRFPDLGINYGVFARETFTHRLATGYVHTDDEDRRNANRYSVASDAVSDAQAIISAGSNTELRIARVK